MNEPTDAVALATPSTRGHLVHPGVWALANGEEVALGGRISRLMARWIDYFSFYAGMFTVSVALASESIVASLLAGTLFVLVVLAQVVGMAVWGRSLGKVVFGLKVIHCSGSRIGALRGLVLREGIRGFCMLTGILVLLDVALIFRGDRRMLHDLWSGSIVIHQTLDWTRVRRALRG